MRKKNCQAQDCGASIPGKHFDALSPQKHYETYGNFCKKCIIKQTHARERAKREKTELRRFYKI